MTKKAIQLVGVWDTVGALGIPFLNGIPFIDAAEKHLLDFADLNLSPRVVNGLQALAIDERRKDFEPTLWNSRPDGSIKQVWFCGVHADIGGGYAETGLSDITLQWMMGGIASLDVANPLRFDATQIARKLAPNYAQDRHDETQKNFWRLRPVLARQIPTDAVLDESVGRRFLSRGDYRPESLRPRPELAEFYASPAQPEKLVPVNERTVPRTIEVNETITMEALAENCWTSAKLEVKAGERYKVMSKGSWHDKQHESLPCGYLSANMLMQAFESRRRVKNAPWFCLIGCVNPASDLESRNLNAGNFFTGMLQEWTHKVEPTDDQSQLVIIGEEAIFDVDRAGFLYFFPNDCGFAYGNNSGYLTVNITRLC